MPTLYDYCSKTDCVLSNEISWIVIIRIVDYFGGAFYNTNDIHRHTKG